jgi:hypothetical protein
VLQEIPREIKREREREIPRPNPGDQRHGASLPLHRSRRPLSRGNSCGKRANVAATPGGNGLPTSTPPPRPLQTRPPPRPALFSPSTRPACSYLAEPVTRKPGTTTAARTEEGESPRSIAQVGIADSSGGG